MTARHVAVVFAVLLLCSCSAVPATAGPQDTRSGRTTAANANTTATIVAAYPNPVARGDPGEFVAIRFASPTNTTGWVLTEGRATVRLPNRTFEGTVTFSTTPDTARRHTDHRVAPLDGRFPLSNGGERLELHADGLVASARYRDAPESRLRNFTTGDWRPLGATALPVTRTHGGTATAFVLPDSPDVPIDTLRSADERLLVAGYTLTSRRVTDALLAAHRNDTRVRVLLDGSPVGGVTERQAAQLDRLVDAGIAVRLLAGPHTRYRFHHAKYAVVDHRVLVLTENFKPAGTGGMSSRGWGVVLDDPAAADTLADLHAADWRWRAATPWSEYRVARDFADSTPALGSFETRHPPEQVTVESASVLVAPDNADPALVSRLDEADDRILVQQVEIGSRDGDLLRAVIRAADRGVTVRVHLDGSRYVRGDNADLAAWLERRADANGWDLEARVDTADGYEKIHTKGVVVDDTVVLGSRNWANRAGEENREVLVALESHEAADYYAGVFRSDWSDVENRSVPAGLLGGVATAVAGSLLVVRRVRFVGRDGVVADWQW